MKVIFIGAIAVALASCSTLRYASDDYIFAMKEMCSGGVYKYTPRTGEVICATRPALPAEPEGPQR